MIVLDKLCVTCKNIFVGYELMSAAKAVRPPFDLCGGHPVLNFVNSLDKRFAANGPVELLADYTDLLRFTVQTRLLEERHGQLLAKAVSAGAAAAALRAARGLREALAVVLYGNLDGRPAPQKVIRALERHFQAASRHRELRWRPPAPGTPGGTGIAWQWGRFASRAALPVWILSQAAAQLLLSDEAQRVRACGAQTCRWLFLDTSKNHTRRWCNMKVCGNRMKARRFQQAQRAGAGPTA
jgi:predicted RNA-binding Zn ribbon-like protein